MAKIKKKPVSPYNRKKKWLTIAVEPIDHAMLKELANFMGISMSKCFKNLVATAFNKEYEAQNGKK